ncbi:hypothetical protein, partial [Alistipes putredinis]|uniref:hypothetical protein n=3 Tax=Bacteria TaxID=2 RepID=UPI003AF7A22A
YIAFQNILQYLCVKFNAQMYLKNSIMNTENREKRLEAIRNGLRRGDGRRIAILAGVHPVWVSYVINGRGVSERVLTIAEDIIAKRGQQN